MVIFSIKFLAFIAVIACLAGRAFLVPYRRQLLIVANAVFIGVFLSPQSLLQVSLIASVVYVFDFWLVRKVWVMGVGVATLTALIFVVKPTGGMSSFRHTIFAPISLSFFSFHMISYFLDRRSKKIRVRPDAKTFFSYALFFPTILAGPIIRPDVFFEQIKQGGVWARPSWNLFVLMFCTGITKKFVIADRLIYGGGDAISFYILAFRTYFDFSGYTDIAIAVAALWGVSLPRNFDRPFLAKNPLDFWGRWHITLSGFLRDYVYYPTFFRWKSIWWAIVITFILNGTWHGLSWNYLFLGLYWVCAVMGYILVQKYWDSNFPKVMQIMIMFNIFVGSFVFFDEAGMAKVGSMLAGAPIFRAEGIELGRFLFVILIISMLWVARALYQSKSFMGQWAGAFLLMAPPLTLVVYEPSKFIYSQF